MIYIAKKCWQSDKYYFPVYLHVKVQLPGCKA